MLPIAVAIVVFVTPTSQPSSPASVATIRGAGQFADAYVGIAGSLSPQFAAMREIVVAADGAAVCRQLVREKNVVAKLYGVLGLRRLDPAAYGGAMETLRNAPDVQVDRMSGCTMFRGSALDVLAEIDRGDYDRSLDKPTTQPSGS